MTNVDEVLKKYSQRIEQQMGADNNAKPKVETSKEYYQFKEDMMPELSRYERWANSIGNIIHITLAPKDQEKISKQLNVAHLEIDPSSVVGLAIMGFFLVLMAGILISVAGFFLSAEGAFPFGFLFLMLIASFFVFYYFYSMPDRLATRWRLKASSQMVPAILYTVVYMKHTSNLERAIGFVSQHVDAPLALDFRKIMWDVETGRYSSVKDSLDNYLENWKESSMEFVESFHLIESSLYEPNEARRVEILERSLKVILDGVYEKMLKYTHDIKSPLTNLYMLGIVLPTLGLALLPLASTLMGGVVKWTHVFVIFDIIIPFFVFYMTTELMLRRPGGYGESSLIEKNPFYYKYVSKRPYYIAGFICFPLFVIGLLPLLFGYTSFPALVGMPSDFPLSSFGLGIFGKGDVFQFLQGASGTVGPFGVVALLMSLLVPFSIAMFFALSFSMRSKELIKARDQSNDLEKEFTSSLFTLGNRIGDGIPAEIAFSKVAEYSKGQKTEEFFKIVNTNIQTMGMGLEEAIFNPRRGALVYYPSGLIATSMRILVESVKKGLAVAAQSLMSISEYVKNIQKINERLRDLLADVISDMKSNMTFLAPLLAGIVVGLAAMITGILGQLKNLVTSGAGDMTVAGFGSVGNITELFDIAKMVPPYFMQIAIGIYIVQIIFILTATLVVIDSGEDRLKKTYEISKNLIRGTMLYLITALISIVALAILASVALSGLGGA